MLINLLFSLGLVLITCPLLLGAGILSQNEKILLAVISLLLFISYFKGRRIGRFILSLALFLAAFLNSQFIFFKRFDLFPFQLAVLMLFFLLNRKEEKEPTWFKDSFSLGLLGLVAITFLLNILVNRLILGFYLNLWVDLKRHWPVFLFALIYSLRSKDTLWSRGRFWTIYFMGLFIFTLGLSFRGHGLNTSLAIKKVKYNLAFFYRNQENWKDMTSSFRRGLVYEYLGLWSKAREEFKRLILASPQDIGAHFNLAQSYLAEKFWFEALGEYRRVIEIDPYFSGSHYGLARAYEALGEAEKMEKELLAEIKVNPREIRAYLSLEEFYRRQGLVREEEQIKSQRREVITSSIEGEKINEANLRLMPVVLNGGAVTIEIIARGTYARGFWPRMEVWLSKAGRLERGGDAFVRSDSWKSYYFRFQAQPGEEKLIVHFTNDFFGGPENDRNLYIKRINFIHGR